MLTAVSEKSDSVHWNTCTHGTGAVKNGGGGEQEAAVVNNALYLKNK